MDPEKTGSKGEEPLPQTVKNVPEKETHHSYNGAGSDIINGHLIELEVNLSRVIGEDDVEGDWGADTSPFPAVRAVVPETDDPAMPVNTLRAWFLGIVSISRCPVFGSPSTFAEAEIGALTSASSALPTNEKLTQS